MRVIHEVHCYHLLKHKMAHYLYFLEMKIVTVYVCSYAYREYMFSTQLYRLSQKLNFAF